VYVGKYIFKSINSLNEFHFPRIVFSVVHVKYLELKKNKATTRQQSHAPTNSGQNLSIIEQTNNQ
jgi:hypothetical protein